jgi:hypothetical protein
VSVRQCTPDHTHHDWQLVDPHEPPPRTHVCRNCGKHAPARPEDPDYDIYGEKGQPEPACRYPLPHPPHDFVRLADDERQADEEAMCGGVDNV